MTKVAVVDSGIDKDLYTDKVIEHIEFIHDNITNKNHHGNLCCSALLNINPNVEIYDIKILNEHNCCSANTLLAALEYINNTDIRIVNLSLASNQYGSVEQYYKVIDKLNSNGKVVVASLANNGEESFPACLKNTIGVSGNTFINNDEYWYNRHLNIQCIADEKPILLKSSIDKYEMFGGNSKATAVFSGILAKYIGENNTTNFNEIQKGLMQQADKTQWIEIKEECPEFEVRFYKKEILNGLVKLVKTTLNVDIHRSELMQNDDYCLPGLNRYNAFLLVRGIEKYFNIRLNYNKINIFWFYSIKNLYYMVEKEMYSDYGKEDI